MKVKVNTQKETFQPIELVITIENEQDLINLWHRFYLTKLTVNNSTTDFFNGKMCTDDHFDIFDVLNDLAIERNLKSK